jgi:hypothetical protein
MCKSRETIPLHGISSNNGMLQMRYMHPRPGLESGSIAVSVSYVALIRQYSCNTSTIGEICVKYSDNQRN